MMPEFSCRICKDGTLKNYSYETVPIPEAKYRSAKTIFLYECSFCHRKFKVEFENSTGKVKYIKLWT